MAEMANLDRRLDTTREQELLQSFVLVNVGDEDEGSARAPSTPSRPNRNILHKTNSTSHDDGDKKKLSTEEQTKLLSAEKKKRRDKRLSQSDLQEELYCDKDRAAAASMGSKDIKQSLRLKRKQDRTKALHIPEEARPKTFLALGQYEMCRKDLNVALDFINKALELNHGDKDALVARSRCYIVMDQPENALKDAEAALHIDQHFLKAIYQKAEALYYLGNFEHSLVFYHRGLHIRPDHDDFKKGVHKARKAIENAVGTVGVKPTKPAKEQKIVEKSKSQDRRLQSSSANSKRSDLLKELNSDKHYLNNLINNPNIKCRNTDSNIEKCIQDTIDYLAERQEFWKQQFPKKVK